LTRPRPGGGSYLAPADRFIGDNIDAFCDDKQFPGDAQQGLSCSALVSAMREITLSLGCGRPGPMTRQDFGIDE